MPDKLYNISQTIVKYGIYLILATPLFVSKQLFFPFVSTKIFIFRTLVEIVFIFWLILLFKDKSYRPKINHFIYLAAAFLFYLFISAVLGANFYHSFWGTIQRGGGLFVLLHLFVFFLILISFCRSAKDWANYLLFFVSVSLLVSLYALMQRLGASYVYESGVTRATGTIGNAATLAGYLIFSLFLLLILFFKEDKRYKKIFYGCGFLLELAVIAISQTRGAMLAVVAGLGLWLIIGIFIAKTKKTRIILLSILAALAFGLILLFSFRQSSFVSHNSILSRFTAISINDTTAQTRLFAWRSGWQAFKDKPLLGWGLENFNIAYNRYFDANYYNYVIGEAWFDYAHNIIIELLATTGAVGLLLYLSIALLLGKYLWHIFKTSDKILASGLLVMLLAYFGQNLLVFDSINTYLGLSLVIGYIFYLRFASGNQDATTVKISRLNNWQTITILLVCLVSFYSIYHYNIKIAQSAHYVRQVFNEENKAEKDYAVLFGDAKRSLAVRNFWGDEFICEYSNLFRDMIRADLPAEQKQAMADLLIFLINEGEYFNKLYPNDAMFVSRLAILYELKHELGDLDSGVLNRGEELVKEAIALSPQRIPAFYILAQFYEYRGEHNKALEILNKGVKLNPAIPDTYWSLAKVYSEQNKSTEVIANVKKAVELNYSFKFVGDIKQILPIFEVAKDYQTLIKLYLQLIPLEPDNFQNYASLAYLYKEAGDYAQARETALKILSLDQTYAPQVEEFLRSLPQ